VKTRNLGAKPMCAVCGRPVEAMLEEHDEFTQRVLFTAVCHGQRERVRVDVEVLQGVRGIAFGVAFSSSPRQLSDGQPKLGPVGDE